MENKKGAVSSLSRITQRLSQATLPPELKQQVAEAVARLEQMGERGADTLETATALPHLDWLLSLPWAKSSADNLDLDRARQVLEKNHYGLGRVKERILEYLAVLNLTKGQAHKTSPVLCFLGLPGIGKTSVAVSIAQALERRFLRIALGGLGEVTQLRGLPRHLPGAEPGQIIKGLRRVGVKNPVILLDEIDRVAEEGRAAVMGALLEILDPEQNNAFMDYYLGFPFDLSEVLFIGSANNTRGISTAVLDRLEIIEMPSYSDAEKKVIGRDYLLPKALAATGMAAEQITLEDALWPKIIRPLGYDAGLRTLTRTLEGICRKAALKLVESGGKEKKFVLTEENIKEFLPSW